MTARAVALFAILFASAALVAGEIPVSSIVYTGAPSFQSEVQGASDGLNFLLAWRDFRDRSQAAIYAARVDSRGRLLDSPTAIRIPAPLAGPPVVAWTGSVYLIAWADIARMRFLRVDTSGHVLDLTPGDFGNIAARPVSAASCGNRAMIVYLGSPAARSPSNFHAVLFDSDGNVVKRDIALGSARSSAPVVACTGGSFYVAWNEFDGVAFTVQGALVNAQGEAGQTRPIASSVDAPMLASNGSDFLLAFTDRQGRLTVAHIDLKGVPTSTQILLQYKRSGPPGSFGNFIGRYRDGYLLAAYDRQKNPVGVVLGRAGDVIAEIALAPGSVLVSNDRETLATWAESVVGLDIVARIAGSEEAPTLVSTAAAQQTSARIAFGGVCYLAVWLETRGSDGAQLRAGRLALDGTQLDGEGMVLADHIFFVQPQVVFDGQYFVIAWEDGSVIRINRMMTNGLLLEGVRGRVAVEDHRGAFALGSNGRESLLVWTAPLNSGSILPFLHAMRMATDSTFFPLVVLLMDVRAPLQPAVAGTPGQWLISWSDGQQNFSPNDHSPRQPPHILGARLNEKLELLDPAPLTIAASDDTVHVNVAAAAGDSDFLVTWIETGRAGLTTVHARSVALDGTLGNSKSFGPGSLPSVSKGGGDFVIAWQERENLFYARFNHPEFIIPLADSENEESRVSLASGPDDALIAVYERRASEALYGDVSRSFARQFRIPPSEPRKRIVVH